MHRWVLIERIGKGGMGEVYRAHQLNLKRDVAIKVLSGDILQDVEENPQNVPEMRRAIMDTLDSLRHAQKIGPTPAGLSTLHMR